MRKTTLGISLVALLGFAGTAAADHSHDGDCGHAYADDDYYDDGYAYADYDDGAYYDDDAYYGDDYDYAANGWITPTVTIPVVKTVVVQPRNGYVWVEGRWSWNGYEWTWIDGHWIRARSNYDWVQGSWQYRNGYQRWVDGRWKARTKIVVKSGGRRWNRDHHDHGWNDRDGRRGGQRWGKDRWGKGKGKRWNNGGGRGTTKVVVRNHRRGRR